jgi:chromosome condensin MukBEF MukE localization factor
MGVNPTPWGFSVYDQIIQKLVAQGVPRQQIAAIGDADSDAKKQALFEKVRSGQVRMLRRGIWIVWKDSSARLT